MILFLLLACAAVAQAREECTTAIITGSVTTDGRPLLWKNRDTSDHWSEVIYFEEGDYPYITLTTVHDSINARLGVNESGFAIMNAVSHNLGDTLTEGITNGALMKEALASCSTIAEFELLLQATSDSGRSSPANLGVIDALGGAAFFEVDNHTHLMYDANDPDVAPDGFLVRANFSFRADTTTVDTWRYHQAYRMVDEAADDQRLDVTAVIEIARNLRNDRVDPYPLPYPKGPPEDPLALGFVNARETINRNSTACFGIVRGVRPGEDPRLSTFYAAPGHPVVTMVLPVWVAAGATPDPLDGTLGSPISSIAYERTREAYCARFHPSWVHTYFLVHGDGEDGFLVRVEQIESWLLPQTEAYLQDWYANGFDPEGATAIEHDLAAFAYAEYELPVDAPVGVVPLDDRPVAIRCWPNPTRQSVLFRPADRGDIAPIDAIVISDLSGRIVRRLAHEETNVLWDGRDRRGRPVASGIYFFRTTGSDRPFRGSLVVAR